MSRWQVLGFAMSVALIVVGSARTAAACSPAISALGIEDAPSNGVVTISVHCDGSRQCVLPEDADIAFKDTTSGALAPGAVVHRADGTPTLIGWKADSPLVPGRIYELTWRPQDEGNFSGNYTFAALPPAAFRLEDLYVEAELEVRTEYTGELCIGIENDATCEEGPLKRVALQAKRYALLGLTVRSRLAASDDRGQYELRFGAGTVEESERLLNGPVWGQDALVHTWDEQAESYCYSVELRSLIDDSTRTLQGCVAHGSLDALGSTPLSDAEVTKSLMQCATAPQGYEALWCNGMRERCAELERNDAEPSPFEPTDCTTLAEKCAMYPSTVTADDADAAVGAGDLVIEGAAGSGGDPFAHDQVRRDEDNGCSITGAVPTREPPAWLTSCSALLAAVLLRRRRVR